MNSLSTCFRSLESWRGLVVASGKISCGRPRTWACRNAFLTLKRSFTRRYCALEAMRKRLNQVLEPTHICAGCSSGSSLTSEGRNGRRVHLKLQADLAWILALVWVAKAGLSGEPQPQVHYYSAIIIGGLSERYKAKGSIRRSQFLRAKAERHLRPSGWDPLPPAAAMAMPIPQATDVHRSHWLAYSLGPTGCRSLTIRCSLTRGLRLMRNCRLSGAYSPRLSRIVLAA